MKLYVLLFVLFLQLVTSAKDQCFVQSGAEDGSWQKFLCVTDQGKVYVRDDPLKAEQDVFDNEPLTIDMNTMYALFCGCLIFFMQTGFAMLEAGAVHLKNVQNILFKNLMDASLGAIVWYLIGFGFAYGGDDDGPFIGQGGFAIHDEERYMEWFFQYTFAATAATIVSGSVAERCKLSTYFAYATVLTLWVYPVVVHWVWDGEGWLANLGVIDFAGSGVVHLVGGCCGLMGAVFLGPRIGTFDENGAPIEQKREPHKTLLQSLGTTILWFGWYGFNCGSSLAISGSSILVSRVAVVTTLAGASGGVTTALLGRIMFAHYDLGLVFNGILTGLVAICACVATIEVYVAIPIGILAGMVYVTGSRLCLSLQIDDPVDAFPVHGCGGMFGILCPAIFSSSRLIAEVYSEEHAEFYRSGQLIGYQVAALCVIAAWALFHSAVLFGILKYTVGIRVDKEHELAGLDASEHGGHMYTTSYTRQIFKPNISRIFTGNESELPTGAKTPKTPKSLYFDETEVVSLNGKPQEYNAGDGGEVSVSLGAQRDVDEEGSS